MVISQAADKEEAATGYIHSEGDLFIPGTQSGLMSETGKHVMFHPSEVYPCWTVGPPTDTLKQYLQQFTGWQNVPRPVDEAVAAQ